MADAAQPQPPRPRFTWPVLAVAAVQVAVLVAFSGRYGYHRDEFYFIVAGSHPAFGYPDQPPLVPLLCWAMNVLAPGSLLVLRLPSALAAGATTVVAALVAREVGGGRGAQAVAAGCAAVSAFALVVGHFVTTTTFDLLSTSLLGWLLIRAVLRSSGPAMLAAGIVAGIGSEAKPQVALVALVAVGALLVVGPRAQLRTGWFVGAVLACAAIAAPYVVWQGLHGWPQVTVARNIAGSAEGGRAGFLPFQLVMVSPFLVPVWIAGLVTPWRRPGLPAVRFIPITFLALAAAYLIGDGKAYYLASCYPVLLGLGAAPAVEWARRGRAAVRRAVLVASIAVSAAVSAMIALPLLPPAALQGSAVMALNPDQGETVGWPAFLTETAEAWQRIPAGRRAHTVIFTSNYGEAGAIDVLGASYHLPPAYSAHNGFAEWARPAPSATRVLLVGYPGPAAAEPSFTGCTRLGTVDDHVGLANDEQGLPLQLCRPARSWSELWPGLRHDD